MVALALARYLEDLTLVTFDETGTSGDCFLEDWPASPAAAVLLRSSGGHATVGDEALGYDEPTVGVDVRAASITAAHARSRALYAALQGLHDVTLDAGGENIRLLRCAALSSDPSHMHVDAQGRHVYTQTFALHVRALTTNRS